MKFIILTLVFQVVGCDWSLQPKEINYIFKRTECKRFNRKFIEKFICSNKFVNRSQVESTAEIHFLPGIKVDNVFLEIITYKKFGTVFRPSMIKLTENFCDLVANRSHSFLAIQYRKLLSTSITNFLEPCPLMGKKYLYGKKKGQEEPVYSTSFFPPLIPIGDWKIVSEMTTQMNGEKEFMLESADFFEITQKTATQF